MLGDRPITSSVAAVVDVGVGLGVGDAEGVGDADADRAGVGDAVTAAETDGEGLVDGPPHAQNAAPAISAENGTRGKRRKATPNRICEFGRSELRETSRGLMFFAL